MATRKPNREKRKAPKRKYFGNSNSKITTQRAMGDLALVNMPPTIPMQTGY